MPPPRAMAPLPEAPRVENRSELQSLLDLPQNSRKAIESNDWTRLTVEEISATTAYLCRKYGLPEEHGFICTIKTNGVLRPYVQAEGVFYITRGKVNTTVEMLSVPSGYVAVKARSVDLKGIIYEAIGCKPIGSKTFDVALMQADTAARCRSCKFAVGLTIMTYAEASSLDETGTVDKELEKKND